MVNWNDISKTYVDYPDFTPNKFSAELSIGHTLYIERLPAQPDIGWMLDGLDYVEHLLNTEDTAEAQRLAVDLIVKKAQAIALKMQGIVKDLSWESVEVVVPLPDGRYLAAADKRDADYTGIKIEVRNDPEKPGKLAAWIEYDKEHAEYDDEQRLRVFLWKGNYGDDESDEPPVINMGFDLGDFKEC